MTNTFSRHFLASLIAVLLIISCKKETTVHALQARIDGVLVTCDSAANITQSLSGILYGIEGGKKGGLRIKLLFPIGNGKGTYYFLSSNASYQNEGWVMYGIDSQFKSTDGSVTITEVNGNRYRGTFSFQAKSYAGGVRTVTDGSFDISY